MGLAEPELAGGSVWWIEGRPSEGGRQVIVRDGEDAIPQGFSARTRVHEYGGGAYVVLDGALVFSNDDDGRLWRIDGGSEPVAITPEPESPRALRYADMVASRDGATIVCVRESHRSGTEAVNELVSLPADGGADPEVVASGADFYSSPRYSQDGRLAWLTWDHPRMPWEGTELWVDGERVAGGASEAIFQPEWSPDGDLHWISDRSGWWNVYREDEPLHQAEAEFGWPQWVFRMTTYAFLDDGRIACMWSHRGFPHVGLLDPSSGELTELTPEYLPDGPTLRSDGKRVSYVGGSPTRTSVVAVLDPEAGTTEVVARSTPDEPDPAFVSEAEPLEYDSNGRTAHALFYAPVNPDFEGPADDLPPLIVMSHGGPTAQTGPELDLRTQFWTTRGFAVVDVNYGGSTGYGRAYRDLLHEQWGVVDLEDCTEAALSLARDGRVDGERLAIRGGSAGGYTTLCALAWTDVFHAGASYFGVADIEALFAETHKFESRYDLWLVPEDKRRERSPIHRADEITAAVIIFQGLDDAIVLPSQAELIVEALKRRGVEYEYHVYEGESHGFRKAETIIDSLEKELAFYLRVL